MSYRMTIPQAKAIHALAVYAGHEWAKAITAGQAAAIDIEELQNSFLEVEGPQEEALGSYLVKSFKQTEIGRIRWVVDAEGGISFFVFATGEAEKPGTEEMNVYVFPSESPEIHLRVAVPQQMLEVIRALNALGVRSEDVQVTNI